jgi:hypothetical protein
VGATHQQKQMQQQMQQQETEAKVQQSKRKSTRSMHGVNREEDFDLIVLHLRLPNH